jgi:hypothetical protein
MPVPREKEDPNHKSCQNSAINNETVVGAAAYDGRVILYIIKGERSAVGFCISIYASSRPDILH